jgi:hypothetical protein
MRRSSLTALLLIALVLPGAAAAQSPSAVPAGRAAAAPVPAVPAVKATVAECGIVTSRKLTGVSFSAEMPYVTGAESMWLRFELLSRAPGESEFTRVANSGDGWYREKAVKVFDYDDKIFALPDLGSAADYRARVTFRWNDADGRALLVAKRLTPVCRLAPQPNLQLGALTTQAGGAPGLLRYTIAVRNAGRADTGTFDVGLRIGSEDRPPVTVTGVAAGATQPVSFTAPRCAAGDVLRFEADPTAAVAESDETDNVLSVACPATG